MSDIPLRGGTEVVLIEATYNPTQLATNLLFKLRKRLSDTDCPNAQWTDAELWDYLADANNIVLLAAADALEDRATDASFLAVIAKNEGLSTDLTKLSSLIAERAQRYRDLAPIPCVVISSPPTFTRGDPDNGVVGTMDVW